MLFRSVSLPLPLSVSLPLPLSVSLSVSLSLCLSVCLSLSLSLFFYVSLCVCVCVSLCLSLPVSLCVCVCLSLCVSVWECVWVSLCVSGCSLQGCWVPQYDAISMFAKLSVREAARSPGRNQMARGSWLRIGCKKRVSQGLSVCQRITEKSLSHFRSSLLFLWHVPRRTAGEEHL